MPKEVEIILVSKGREDFLALTLNSILHSTLNVVVKLCFHGKHDKNNYLLNQIICSFKRPITESRIVISNYPKEMSLACIRATEIKRLENNIFIMMDNDVTFNPKLLGDLIYYGNELSDNDSKLLCAYYPAVDVANEREYPDFSHNVYNTREEQIRAQPEGNSGRHAQIIRSNAEAEHSSTHAMWRKDNLIKSGVLDKWLSYPAGHRFYDYSGTKMATKNGYTVYHLGSDTKNGLHVFWHMWTKRDDSISFPEMGMFNKKVENNITNEQEKLDS